MTECGPLISYEDWFNYAFHSCGKELPQCHVRIDSEAPTSKDGEIQVKGINVMRGYYKNEEATKAVFTEDGWMRTGDLGVLDKAGNIYIHGRSKNMILGPSGQNIYPEEIEDKLNSMPCVVESIVLEREGVELPPHFITSSETRQGREELLAYIDEILTGQIPA